MHCVILANGSIPDPEAARRIAAGAGLLICADGGSRYALAWELRPDLVVGDFDSLSPAELRLLEQQGAHILRHPTHKDETDLELALQQALDAGATRITLLGALGDRLDHSVGNLLLLAWPALAGQQVTIVDGADQIRVVRDRLTLHGQPGDIISLLPLSEEAHGVRTVGLEYPLCDETLYLGRTRGISNVLLGKEAEVSLLAGLLLVIQRAGGA